MDFVQIIKSHTWCGSGMPGVEVKYGDFKCTYDWYWAMIGFDTLVVVFYVLASVITWVFVGKWWNPVQIEIESRAFVPEAI